MPNERNSKKRNSLSDALKTVRPTLKAPSSAPLPKTSTTPRRSGASQAKPHTAEAAERPRRSTSSAFPGIQGAPLSLAVRRQVLSTARAYLSEKEEERKPGDRLGLKCAFLASRRTSKASRFIRNLKENSIEQKLIAQARMQQEDEETVGPDHMLDEACQLAAQLHELSNHESINLEISEIAKSITVCTDLLNNLHATGLSHTLHLDQIAADLNTVHEGHGLSKALLEELQKDIAAMRAAIKSIKINTGTVAPVAPVTPVGCSEGTSPVEISAESMCPLLDHLEEKTTMMLSQMEGNDLEEMTQSEDFFRDWVVSKVSEDARDEVEARPESDDQSCWPSKWEDLISETAKRWRAQVPSENRHVSASGSNDLGELHLERDREAHDENAVQMPMRLMRSEPSSTVRRLPMSMAFGGGRCSDRAGHEDHPGLQGSGHEQEPLAFDTHFPSSSFGDEMWSAASDGHWILPSDVATSNDGSRGMAGAASFRTGQQWRRSMNAKDGVTGMLHHNDDADEATSSFLKQTSKVRERQDEERPQPSYFQGQDGARLPCLLHGTSHDKMSPSKTGNAFDVPSSFVNSPFFPLGHEVEDEASASMPRRWLKRTESASENGCSTSASESSGTNRTSEGEFLFRSTDLHMLLGDGIPHPRQSIPRGGYGQDEQQSEWNLRSLGADEWELMATCLQCPGYGGDLRQRLLEPVGFWPSRVANATAMGPVGPIYLDRSGGLQPSAPAFPSTQRRKASIGSLAKAKVEMARYVRERRRSSLPYILGLAQALEPPLAV